MVQKRSFEEYFLKNNLIDIKNLHSISFPSSFSTVSNNEIE